MIRMIVSVAVVLGTLQLMLMAQDADPAGEKAAPATFQEALKVAQSEHIANLEVALKLAVAEEKLDEAVYMRRLIKIEEFRAKVTDTKWTFNRPKRPDTIEFLGDRVVKTGGGLDGVWEVIDERIVVAKWKQNNDLTLYMFNEDFDEYKIKIHSLNTNHNFAVGRRVRGK